MPVDKWGIPLLYPSKSGGFEWFQLDDIANDEHFHPDGMTSSGGGSFTIHFSGPTSPDIFTDRSFENTNSIGGCNMDFAQTASRGYIYKPNDPRDVELKVIVNIQSGKDGGLSISGNTGRHSGSGCCSGFDYMINMQYLDDPAIFRFRKEMWHVSYHTDPVTGEFTLPDVNFKLQGHGNIGVGFIRYNKKDGVSSGKDSVVIELWMNLDPDNNPENWKMMKRTEDKGGWGNDGDKCNGAKDQIGTWGGPKYRIKSNDSSATMVFKHLSLREIDPNGSFDDNPNNPPPPDQPPDPTTIQGQFKIQWNVNTIGASSCQGTGVGGGGGGEVGNTKFYTVYTDSGTDSDKELSDSSTFQNRKRLVMSPASSSSIFSGKIPRQIDIPLEKVGTPTTPDIHCKIWNSSGTVVYDSPTTIDPSTLTTSYTKQIFDFSTNTHTLVVGDRIGVEFTGTSSSNYVIASYKGTSTANTKYYQYEGTTWQSKTRSLVMDVWE